MHIVIATGGSGGHIFPALRVAEVLRARGHHVRLIGAVSRWQDALGGFDAEDVPAKGWSAKSLKDVLIFIGSMIKSFVIAWQSLCRRRPEMVIGFGGYGSFPAVMAGCVLGIYTVIHEQNVVPGRANRVLALFVRKILVSFDESQAFFARAKTVVSGYPLRFWKKDMPREVCLRDLGLDPARKTVAVCGGSQGSRALNHIMVQAAGLLLARQVRFQVVHMTGERDADIVAKGYRHLDVPHKVVPFFLQMEKVYGAADLIIARAGSGLIHEIAHYGLPAIIVPYPHARAHQRRNAEAFLRMGKGVIIDEPSLTQERLAAEIMRILTEQGTTEIKECGVRGDRQNAAVTIADIVEGTFT